MNFRVSYKTSNQENSIEFQQLLILRGRLLAEKFGGNETSLRFIYKNIFSYLETTMKL